MAYSMAKIRPAWTKYLRWRWPDEAYTQALAVHQRWVSAGKGIDLYDYQDERPDIDEEVEIVFTPEEESPHGGIAQRALRMLLRSLKT